MATEDGTFAKNGGGIFTNEAGPSTYMVSHFLLKIRSWVVLIYSFSCFPFSSLVDSIHLMILLDVLFVNYEILASY